MLRPRDLTQIPAVYRYGAAIFGVVGATAVRFTLAPYVGSRLPFVVFYFAVIPSAWHLGLGPSLMAIALATVSAWTFFIPSFRGFGIAMVTDLIGATFFVVVNLVIVWFAEVSRIIRRRLELEVAERVRAEAIITEQVHRAEFGRDIGLALTSGPTLATVLDRCVALTVLRLGGTQARIDTVGETGLGLDSKPSAGDPNSNDRDDAIVDLDKVGPMVRGLVGRIASERLPLLTNSLEEDSGSFQRSWAIQEKMVALAGCPLVVEDRLIGVWTLFSQTPLTRSTLEAMESVANPLALGIERKRAEENLRVGEARKAAILETSLDAIITMNHLGKVVEFNPAAERIFGVAAASIRGRDLSEMIMPPRFRAAHHQGLEHYLTTGEAAILDRRIEVQAVRADGTEFPVELAVARIPIAGQPMFTAHIRDIGARKLAEEALRSAKRDAEEANQAKDRFISILSHELRTPLNPIALTVDSILRKIEPDDDLRDDLESIRHYVGKEARLIDDLLDVTRIARGKMSLRTEIADAHHLIEQAVGRCVDDFSAKSLRVVIDLQADHHLIQADPNRLRQVFWNLIKNAVKFTLGGGSITVRSRNEAIVSGPQTPDLTESSRHLIVEVSDDGIGIDPADLPRIFEAFQQGEPSTHRQFGGLGLGLAICSGVVEGLGGQISVRSDGKGLGTTFTVRLRSLKSPLVLPEGSTTSPASNPDVSHPSFSTRAVPASGADSKEEASLEVLVVEDEPTTIRLMSRLIRGLGHQVTTAETIAEASRWVDGSKRFDLVVSDIGLPDGTGLDLMRRIRATRGMLPGIALTGYGTVEDIEQSRLAGFSAHMTKPIDFNQLETLIRQVAGSVPLAP